MFSHSKWLFGAAGCCSTVAVTSYAIFGGPRDDLPAPVLSATETTGIGLSKEEMSAGIKGKIEELKAEFELIYQRQRFVEESKKSGCLNTEFPLTAEEFKSINRENVKEKNEELNKYEERFKEEIKKCKEAAEKAKASSATAAPAEEKKDESKSSEEPSATSTS